MTQYQEIQSKEFLKFCKKSGVKYTDANFRVLWDYIKNTKWPERPADWIIGSDVYAMVFLDIKDKLEFEPPPPAPPTIEQLRAEHDRRLEATANIGPLSSRKHPNQTDDPIGAGGTLKEFVKKAVDNLDRQVRREVPPSREKPKKFRTILNN